MPSLVITLLSIFKIAALIVRAFGKTVKPILIAFERFASSTVISFLTSPPFYIKKKNLRMKFFENIFPKKNKKQIYGKAHSYRKYNRFYNDKKILL
jgi:hypothetical protein